MLALDNELTDKITSGQMSEEDMSTADQAVIESVCRLFPAMHQSVRSEFLRKNIMQEVIYYLLCGSCGRQFLQSIANTRQVDEIYEANSWIKENFRSSFTVEGASLMAIQTNDPKITLVAGGYPLFVNGKIAGRIVVGGGMEAEDCAIAEHVVSVFEELVG